MKGIIEHLEFEDGRVENYPSRVTVTVFVTDGIIQPLIDAFLRKEEICVIPEIERASQAPVSFKPNYETR